MFSYVLSSLLFNFRISKDTGQSSMITMGEPIGEMYKRTVGEVL